MSSSRGGSQTPLGKRSHEYPLTPSHAPSASSAAIHIAPRASPRAHQIATANAGMHMAASCPTFSWQPPAAPSARPRIPSVDPPPMELPPSPPVFSPMQAEAIKAKKEDAHSSINLKKQIYSRSLSNYSSSAPTHVDFLSKFHPHFEPLAEGNSAVGEESEEEEEEEESFPTGRAAAGRIGIGRMAPSSSRLHAVAREDDFSLSKSPTIFSIMSTSAQGPGPVGLHTADTSLSTSSNHSGSPGHSILGSIAVGEQTGKRRSIIGHKPPMHTVDSGVEDDLQFSISLTDEQEGEGEEQSNQQDSLPLY